MLDMCCLFMGATLCAWVLSDFFLILSNEDFCVRSGTSFISNGYLLFMVLFFFVGGY